MGCSFSNSNTELPEKLNWTRPDFDELCSKGENSLKLLNEIKHGAISSWDRLLLKFGSNSLSPDTAYLLILILFSQEGKGDFPSIDLHLSHTLPGYSKITTNNSYLSEISFCWEEFCNDLLISVPKIHSIQEDIIQTAEAYYQVMVERLKNKDNVDSLDKEVEEAVKQNLKILTNGADYFHQVLLKITDWVEKLCKFFVALSHEKITEIHQLANKCQGMTIANILDKEAQALQSILTL